MSPRSAEVAPLQAIHSTDESEMEEPGRPRRAGGLVAVGLISLGMMCVVGGRKSLPAGVAVGSAGAHFDGLVEIKSKALGSEAKPEAELKAKAKAGDCAWGLQNCNASKCCNNPGMQCFAQTHWYAQCRETCKPGPDPTHWDAEPWSCKELGERKEGTSKCSDQGENCKETQCCNAVGTQCYTKDDEWATCKSECTAGFPDLGDYADNTPWECKPLGDYKKGASDWVQEKCTTIEGEPDCSKTQCCAEPGKQCYQQQEYFAQCKFSCPENEWESDWSCKELGSQTPDAGGPAAGRLGEWVQDTCVGENADCRDAKCCLNMNQQCYEKDKDWGVCLDSCAKGRHPEDNNETWSCKELGPRTISGLAVKGAPSLFCWSLFQTTTYEMGIMQAQLKQNAGIFQCDEYALLSTDKATDMGVTEDGEQIKTIHIEKAEITLSVDGTAGNAKLFINCWNAIVKDGRWKRHAWIIKVDPDAVIVADRVRGHLRSHTLENVYVVNCNKFPESPNFPMMYGSVEIFSFLAIDTFAKKSESCIKDMGSMLGMWGEDYYMTHCLDHIGVGRISDFGSVGDNVCLGGSCGDQFFSAFHPYKSPDAWQQCWDEVHGRAPPPAPAQEQQWM